MAYESDLAFFVLLARKGNLSAAALELGLSPPAVSKRLAKLEDRLGVRLLHRTTRRVSLTGEGEGYLTSAIRILRDIEELEGSIATARENPKGLLRVNATFGFGREHVAAVVSAFAHLYPDLEVQLVLTDALNLVEEGFDLGIRFGDLPNSRLNAKKLLRDRRFLCAAPSYLAKYGSPKQLEDLANHNCIVLRQDRETYDVWRFQRRGDTESVKVSGTLSSNDGEIALKWVLDGHGIMLRSEWDIAHHVSEDRLRLVLPRYAHADADIYAVYPERHNLSAKVRLFVDFLAKQLRERSIGARPLRPS
ncbi:LysR family transcriptional regulator [Mesorhizobium sp. WSM2239]|uniref:LysR family transcriptional regulator n=2 Tax=unclassified Mesorhizobium TaxID=325217 RepID=A0AAU8DCM0_9HYPH